MGLTQYEDEEWRLHRWFEMKSWLNVHQAWIHTYVAINMGPYLLDMQWSLKNMIPSRCFCKWISSVVHNFFWKLNHVTTKIWSMSCWQVTTYCDAVWTSSCIIWNLILTNFRITWVMSVKCKVRYSPGLKLWRIFIGDGGPRTWLQTISRAWNETAPINHTRENHWNTDF